jgi:ABC-type sugar transport system ATPase subunit
MKLLAPASENSAALRLAGMDKSYGPMPVLVGFDLAIGRGEVVALMGANGAGKSTLAKIASGVLEPDKGRIFVAGREVKLASPEAARFCQAISIAKHQKSMSLEKRAEATFKMRFSFTRIPLSFLS